MLVIPDVPKVTFDRVVVVLVATILGIVVGKSCESAVSRNPPVQQACLNPVAVQAALDGCVTARTKFSLPDLSSRADEVFKACQSWSINVACVRASMPVDGGSP